MRLLFLDRPIPLTETPISKKSFNATGPAKQMPQQIPKGFSLEFAELLRAIRPAAID